MLSCRTVPAFTAARHLRADSARPGSGACKTLDREQAVERNRLERTQTVSALFDRLLASGPLVTSADRVAFTR